MNQKFCPLYSEARQADPWKTSTTAHAGLLFDKFGNAWRYKTDRDGRRVTPVELEFDKGVGRTRDEANEWLNSFKRKVGTGERLSEACNRQRRLIEELGGKVLFLKNTDRFVTGMGREHPLENGFAWHHTLGVPYLPGSSLKGALRAWLREETGRPGKDRDGNDVWMETDEIKSYFGELGQAGRIILFDMLPLSPPQLDVDVMTPHYGPYYQDKPEDNVPGDWHSPVPISFLTVASGQAWQMGIAPAAGARSLDETAFESLITALLAAVEINGTGAKSAVGYGRFQRDREAEQRQPEEAEKRRCAEEEAARLAAEQAAFEVSLANDSEPLRQLKQLQRDQNWQRTAGDHNMITALQKFADENPNPPQDCLDWIREWLESIPNYKGVWADPEAMKGKKGDRNKYGSKAIRELVKRLNPKLKKA